MNKYFKYIFKSALLVFTVAALSVFGPMDGLKTATLVFLAGFSILKDKFLNNHVMNILFATFSSLALLVHPLLFAAVCASIYDLVFEGKPKTAVIISLSAVYFLSLGEYPVVQDKYWIFLCFLFFIAIAALAATVISEAQKNHSRHISLLDDERRLRYELETTKSKLLSSTREATRLAEFGERNRIAREIHDNVGHGISGTLIQLQAAARLLEKSGTDEKALKMLKTCVEELSGSLSMLRETVHKIKPSEPLGHAYLTGILDAFRFCELDFKFTGDMNKIQPEFMEIIGATLKEALTNISRHSGATRAWVAIDNNPTYLRLLVKDNGKGCKSVTEGMGLGGMKERIRGVGGTFSFGPSDEGFEGREGFMIVCVLLKTGEGDRSI